MDQVTAADPDNAMLAFHAVDLYRSLGLVHGYAGHAQESLRYLRHGVEILDKLVARDPGEWPYAITRAELQGRVASLLVKAGSPAEARAYAKASIDFFKKVGDNPNATAEELTEAVRATDDTEVKEMRDYAAGLRLALRADDLTKHKNPAIAGFLAEAYALNGRYPEALEIVQRGLANLPATKPGGPPSRLRQWLQEEESDYAKKTRAR